MLPTAQCFTAALCRACTPDMVHSSATNYAHRPT